MTVSTVRSQEKTGSARHPLAPLTVAEAGTAARAALDASGPGSRLVYCALAEPAKEAVRGWDDGGRPVPREALCVVYERPRGLTWLVTVALDSPRTAGAADQTALESVIFGAALRDLLAEYPGRLVLLHWLDALHGMPSAASVAALVRPYAGSYEPYICGPDAFLQVVRSALSSLEVPARKVRVERFLSLAENPFESAPAVADDGIAATLSVSLDGATKVLPWPAGVRMLDVLIAAGLDAPFSCRQGVCGACACQLTGGKIDMAHNEVLEDADLADGYILACQATALTPEVSIDY